MGRYGCDHLELHYDRLEVIHRCCLEVLHGHHWYLEHWHCADIGLLVTFHCAYDGLGLQRHGVLVTLHGVDDEDGSHCGGGSDRHAM